MFQRAYRISLDVHRASLQFPKIEQRALADQIEVGVDPWKHCRGRRQAASFGSWFKRYLLMAIGSADEDALARYCRT